MPPPRPHQPQRHGGLAQAPAHGSKDQARESNASQDFSFQIQNLFTPK